MEVLSRINSARSAWQAGDVCTGFWLARQTGQWNGEASGCGRRFGRFTDLTVCEVASLGTVFVKLGALSFLLFTELEARPNPGY